MPLDTQALPVSLEAQISWQDRGCSTAVERKPHNRKLMRSRVQITALKSFFYFISLSRVSLSKFVKEVQHFSWKMVAEQLSMDTASTIGTELAKRKLKPIENCYYLLFPYGAGLEPIEPNAHRLARMLSLYQMWRHSAIVTNWKSFSSSWHWLHSKNHWSSNVKGYLSSLG